jgi:hypothetical protein
MNTPTAALSEFATDFDGYKTLAGEFFRRLRTNPVPSTATIENGLKALGLALIYLQATELDRYQAEIVLTLAHRKADEILQRRRDCRR